MAMHEKNKSKGSKTLNVMTFKMAQPSLIEASAGTGKTYTITNLVLRALLGVGQKEYCLDRPLEIDEFLIVTFTNAATSDLRARIYERIRAARSCIEDFINFVVGYLHSQNDLDSEGLVKNPSKVKSKLIKVKDPDGNKLKAVDYKDYGEQELQELLLEINVESALEKIGIKDQVFLEIINDLLGRNIVPLRQAALILVRAERKINQASISTIHSFCNSTLTQLYALESGEAFNTELKTDLSDVYHEADYEVWRRLFYKEHSSVVLLNNLGSSSPDNFQSLISELNSVRLSSDTKGFYGFELYDFENYLQKNGCYIDTDEPLEPQIFNYLRSLDQFQENIVSKVIEFYQGFNEQDLAKFYDHETGKATDIFKLDKGVFRLVAKGQTYLNYLHELLMAVKELIALGPDSQEQAVGVYKEVITNNFNFLLNADSKSEALLHSTVLKSQPNNLSLFDSHMAKVRELLVWGMNEGAANCDALEHSSNIFKILVAILMIQAREAKCKELHVMDNDDVLRRLDYALNERGLLGDNLAWAIRSRYPLAMIDEFQDTDPVQFNIFTKIYLNEEALKQNAYCYLIGDPKQSIYAFRGSDINSYLKAKNIILNLTQGQGLYTLDTNYRSSVDVVEATNAIFDTTLNKHNYNPFNEADIPFEPVHSGKGKQLESKLKGKGKDANKTFERDFILNNLEQYLDDEPSEELTLGKLNFNTNANNYVVKVGREFGNKSSLEHAYAKSTAILVKHILDEGFIVKDGVKQAVKSGDIAILVSTGKENDLVQSELWKLQIPSVYFSDKSSVLLRSYYQNGETYYSASVEAVELRYLMEAMCDCTNVKKVSRLLGCHMLSLSTEEFTKFTSPDEIEKEVNILSRCARTWEEYGFLPAFFEWASHPYHNMEARLLELKDGERAYTNYCHICEIIQKVHNQKVGAQTQMHWYNNLLENSIDEVEQDQLKKRLESEHDQVKILTIHKSKGLEFPIVLTPFLWNTKSSRKFKRFIESTKYYAPDPYEHVVMDLDVNRLLSMDVSLPMVDSEGNLLGKNGKATISDSSSGIAKAEARKEATRLLYVALTRARYANFIFVGECKVSESGDTQSSALVKLQAFHELQNVVTENHELKRDVEAYSLGYSLFIDAAKEHPELFTVLNFEPLFDNEKDENLVDDGTQDLAPLPFTTKDEDLGGFDRRAVNISSLPKDMDLPTFAQSFLYKEAIDTSFNIISYSSLTQESKEQANKSKSDSSSQVLASADNSSYELDELDKGSADDSYIDQFLSFDETQESEALKSSRAKKSKDARKNIKSMPLFANLNIGFGTKLLPKEPLSDMCKVEAPNCSWSYKMQSNWKTNSYFVSDFTEAQWVECSRKICYTFPRGANAGTFMHFVLENINFELIKTEGFKSYIIDNVMNEIIDNSRYSSLIRTISRDRELNKRLLAEWFNDVVEAPILAGKYHCFALADLKEGCYEPEMRFLMSNEKFNTSQLDEICRKVAKQLLPVECHDFVEGLTLSESELVGYITGSIDLACRFDLNDSLKLRERDDLKMLLPSQSIQEISESINLLRTHRLTKSSKLEKYDPELFVNADFDKVAAQRKVQDGSNEKYYVIDYKSNYLGSDDEKYNDQHMLKAIYAHRYDVQFMIYTLALYRHLKRRFAIPFDANNEELKAFYDEHVGGVLYLFLRGMKANYNRDALSNGVFAIKLDFEVVYQLDMLFTVGDTQA